MRRSITSSSTLLILGLEEVALGSGALRLPLCVPRAVITSLLLGGVAACGTAPLGRNVEQEIRVETPGCLAARCELRNDRGQWVIEQTPGSVRLITSGKPLEVVCGVPGLTTATARAPSEPQRDPSASATAAGAAAGAGVAAVAVGPAFALGGPFGFLAGTLVLVGAVGGGSLARTADAAQRPFGYPSPVQVLMQCTPADTRAENLSAAAWGLAVRGAFDGEGAPEGAVWVLGLNPAGRAAGAGLRSGDLIFALDNRPVGGTLGLEIALRALSAPVVLNVRRGTEALTLTLAPLP